MFINVKFEKLFSIAFIGIGGLASLALSSCETPKNPGNPSAITSVGETVLIAGTVDEKWNLFKAKYRKNYSDNQDEDLKFQTFKNNLEKIEKMNDEHEKINGHRPFGVNEFTDIDPDEFAKTHLNYRHDEQSEKIDPSEEMLMNLDGAAAPLDIDWSLKGATTPIKDQGSCGSCWAFSATEQLETATFMSSGLLPKLSTQQITSCTGSDNDCGGGWTTTAYDYMKKSGVQTDVSYPYTSGTTGQTGSCQYQPSAVVAHVTGWHYGISPCTSQSCTSQVALEPSLQQVITQAGPASVCINASTWQHYTGGVLASSCASDTNSLDHCAQLVGFGTSADGSQYWIIRNQWGKNWGMNGFIHIKIGNNLCGIANEVTYVSTNAPAPAPSSSPTPKPSVSPTPIPSPKPTPVPSPKPTPTPSPTCVRAVPRVTLTQSQSGPAGSTFHYLITSRNMDSAGCGSSSFHIYSNIMRSDGRTPYGMSTQLQPSSLVMSPGQSVTSNLQVTTRSYVHPGNYKVLVSTNNDLSGEGSLVESQLNITRAH